MAMATRQPPTSTTSVADWSSIWKRLQRPFFLFLAYNGSYGLGRSLLNPLRNRHAEYYADKELPSFPPELPHPFIPSRASRTRSADVRTESNSEGSMTGAC